MKSLVLQLAVTAHQGRRCGVNLERDLRTIERRFAAEGSHFLEVELPKLDDALLAGLTTGILPYVDGFHEGSSFCPVFLSPLWRQVFEDGLLREDANPEAIAAIRQISRLSKKIFEVCSDDAVAAEVDQFIKTDAEVGDLSFTDGAISWLQDSVHALFGRQLAATDWRAVEGHHGPGATAERQDAIERWDFGPSNDEIVSTFDSPLPTVWADGDLPHKGTASSRLVAVPKTAVKPRLISIEPSTHMFIQQGIKDVLYRMLNGVRVCSLSSQEPNQALAWYGSISGELATLDLSEASDRISAELVDRVFSRWPGFLAAIKAVRTRSVVLPSGEGLVLKKFASMGSALTFPLEVMLFTAMTLGAMARGAGEGEFVREVRRLAKSELIRIYGDDIIVPTEHAQAVAYVLQRFGLKVNKAKSFVHGFFRESCGGDYFKGYDVTPVYRRRRMPRDWADSSEAHSLASFANLYHAKYGHSPIPDVVGRILTSAGITPLRTDEIRHDCIAVVGTNPAPLPTRWNAALQRHEVKVPVLVDKARETRASSTAKLRHALYSARGSRVLTEDDGLSRSIFGTPSSQSVSYSTKLKSRWVAVA